MKKLLQIILKVVIYFSIIPITFLIGPRLYLIQYRLFIGEHEFGLYAIVVGLSLLFQGFMVLILTYTIFLCANILLRGKNISQIYEYIMLFLIYLPILLILTNPLVAGT